MIRVLSLRHPAGSVLWSRMRGTCGIAECDRLLTLLAEAELASGSRVVIDFSEVEHLHYRAVPLLLQMAAGCRQRGAILSIVGLSEYLVHILEVAGALAGRDFIEEHEGLAAPPTEPADASYVSAGTLDPLTAWSRGFVAVCPN